MQQNKSKIKLRIPANAWWSRLQRAYAQTTRHVSLTDLISATRSKSATRRAWAAMVMRKQLKAGKPARYFDLACELLPEIHPESENTCRWQAAIVLGEFIPFRPADLWSIIKEFGQSKDKDMRACIACVLLEHFLPMHRNYRSRAKKLAARSPLFAETLGICWPTEESADLQPRT